MIGWLIANIGTIVISIILLALVALIVYILIRDKKKGKSACGSNCGSCPMSGKCHQKK